MHDPFLLILTFRNKNVAETVQEALRDFTEAPSVVLPRSQARAALGEADPERPPRRDIVREQNAEDKRIRYAKRKAM